MLMSPHDGPFSVSCPYESEHVRLRIALRAEELAERWGADPMGCLRYWRRAEREVLRVLRRSGPPDRHPATGCGSVAA